MLINPTWATVDLLFDTVTCLVDGETRRYPIPGWMCKRCHVFLVGESLPQTHLCMMDGEWLTVKGMQVVRRLLAERKQEGETTPALQWDREKGEWREQS